MSNQSDDILVDLANSIIQVLTSQYAMNEQDAEDAAYEIIDGVRNGWGGQYIYFRKIPASRNDQIVASFNGRNHHQLCRDWNISAARLRQILREVAKKHT